MLVRRDCKLLCRATPGHCWQAASSAGSEGRDGKTPTKTLAGNSVEGPYSKDPFLHYRMEALCSLQYGHFFVAAPPFYYTSTIAVVVNLRSCLQTRLSRSAAFRSSVAKHPRTAFSSGRFSKMWFLKIRGSFLEVPVIRIVVFGDLYWGPHFWGNYYILK